MGLRLAGGYLFSTGPNLCLCACSMSNIDDKFWVIWSMFTRCLQCKRISSSTSFLYNELCSGTGQGKRFCLVYSIAYHNLSSKTASIYYKKYQSIAQKVRFQSDFIDSLGRKLVSSYFYLWNNYQLYRICRVITSVAILS